MKFSHARAASRLALLLLATAGLLPLYLVVFFFGRRARRALSYPFYRCCVFLSGLSVETTGMKANGAGSMYVSNHVSYLDVPVLAILADGVFVAKSDVRGWPVFGFLASIACTVFVSRQASKVPGERLEIARRLVGGESIFLFPEGSSSDGTGVLPFRTGLLSAVQADGEFSVPVQPVSIVYGPARSGQRPLSGGERDYYAWYGDMDLLPHLWRLFGSTRKTTVSVHFHPSRLSHEFPSRRALGIWAERTVAVGIRQALMERTGTPESQAVQDNLLPGSAAA